MTETDHSCNYYRIMLGEKSKYAEKCFDHGFMGADFDIKYDLTDVLTDDLKSFNAHFVEKFLEINPIKSKISASLSGGMMHAICKRVKIGDIILSPNGRGSYRIGTVTSDYHYIDEQILPHRRSVKWSDVLIDRQNMSDTLKSSTNSPGTVAEITKHKEEIEQFIGSKPILPIRAIDDTIENPIHFAMEKHLEDFLISNWEACDFGITYDIVEDEGGGSWTAVSYGYRTY